MPDWTADINRIAASCQLLFFHLYLVGALDPVSQYPLVHG